ncbi:alpha-hydroxy acid oxidase [Celerinatantimonas diazotrophica]|uniref:(S)-mandelate dehydrogenase n=1 Tax=Celerinatantimonas diazotrophica TaxID=412034 RepID=A0A4R1K1D6_9GAMM|nr:alpha-hydroxy acid oxidase [Celerinatantimonas diazotrophica]TCK57798.1 (S)-mandelate dehydrogenase [Celerinatantimonas diazotrophica]CAG9298138.1 (S)-mandelate dehydrogenase [Celerinatantimonas diazotrophica]
MLLNLNDYRQAAQHKLPKFAFDYVDGGAEDERTLADNQSVFTRWQFVPPVLKASSVRDLSVNWFGTSYQMPVAVAPTGYNGMLRHRADELLASAAAKAGIPYIQSTVSTSSIEQIGRHSHAHHWFQLYVLKDKKVTEDLLKRARDSGCKVLVVSVDAVHFGNRERDKRNYVRPMKLSLKSYFNIATKPGWVCRTILPQGIPGFGNLKPYLPEQYQKGVGAATYFAEQMETALDWSTLAWLRSLWEGPLLLKGVVAPDDCRKAIEVGCDGVVLSNHGGRQLDGTISPILLLSEIRRVIGGDPLIFIDSGFRRGTDVVKALILGANGVLLGRPLLYAMAAAGEQGALDVMNLLKGEIDRTIAQLGCCSMADLTSDLLYQE